MKKTIYPILLILLATCSNRGGKETAVHEQPLTTMDYKKGTFGYDLEFLRQHHNDAILLHDETNTAQIIVLPAYQGRVMTSTARGNGGDSFGWLNYELIASQEPAEHIHAFGGEERFWLGPEGGQFSIYFKKGVDFTFDNWLVPKEIDTEPFTLTGSSQKAAQFEKEMHFQNYSGTQFDLLVNRNIRLLAIRDIENLLDITLPTDVEAVAFESENILTNKGKQAWNKETGMLSIWILSMMNASDQTTVAIPFKQGDQSVWVRWSLTIILEKYLPIV